MPRASSPMRGFTLIETVVAVAILALTLTAIYEILGWTLRHAGEQRQRDAAWLTAHSLLAQFRGLGSLTPGSQHGRTPQGLEWSASVTPYSQTTGPTDGLFGPMRASALTPLEIEISVAWGDRPSQHVQLRSIEYGGVL